MLHIHQGPSTAQLTRFKGLDQLIKLQLASSMMMTLIISIACCVNGRVLPRDPCVLGHQAPAQGHQLGFRLPSSNPCRHHLSKNIVLQTLQSVRQCTEAAPRTWMASSKYTAQFSDHVLSISDIRKVHELLTSKRRPRGQVAARILASLESHVVFVWVSGRQPCKTLCKTLCKT